MKSSPSDLARLNHDRCFVCGKHNPRGLGVRFLSTDGVTGCEFTVPEGMESFRGTTHGGVLAMLMDSAMARWLYDRGTVAFTAVMTVRYRSRVAPGQSLSLQARRQRRRGRRHYMEAVLHDSEGREVAGAEAVFLQPKPEDG